MVAAAWRGRRAAGMQTMVHDAEFAAIEPSGCIGGLTPSTASPPPQPSPSSIATKPTTIGSTTAASLPS
jgi:hypothetical protein